MTYVTDSCLVSAGSKVPRLYGLACLGRLGFRFCCVILSAFLLRQYKPVCFPPDAGKDTLARKTDFES